MPARHGLSVIIIARNEADRIRPSLESVKDLADEIIVIDAGSTDDTVGICREYTDRVVITSDWPGDGIQKQRALDQATMEWVLRIDADEVVSSDLAREIEAILSRDSIEETVFTVAWATYVFGRYLTNGECGERHDALFVREGSSYTPAFLHAVLIPAAGRKGRLEGRLLHATYRSFHHLITKLADYACLPAAELVAAGKTATLPQAFVHAASRFLTCYVWRRGFLDGWRGLLLATVHGQYAFNKYAAIWAASRPAMPPIEVRE
jgi:glycosyltransferase involved in cell wall biosynthesis